jgi:hypothetical protein
MAGPHHKSPLKNAGFFVSLSLFISFARSSAYVCKCDHLSPNI